MICKVYLNNNKAGDVWKRLQAGKKSNYTGLSMSK